VGGRTDEKEEQDADEHMTHRRLLGYRHSRDSWAPNNGARQITPSTTCVVHIGQLPLSGFGDVCYTIAVAASCDRPAFL
jgi:hypothetical protein